MKYNLRYSLLVGLLAASATLIGCGDGSSTSSPGTGGTSAAGSAGTNAGGSSAGTSAGGTSNGGSGGTNSGGTSNGGTDAGGTDAGGTDAGGTDAGGTDAGGTDAGGTDAGGTDAGGTDAGGTDAGGTDAGGTDAGGTDAGGTDAGGTDAGGTDAGGTDAGGTDAGGTDAGGTDAGGTDAGGTDAGGTNSGGSSSGGTNAGGSSSGGSSSGGSSSGGSSSGGSSSGGSGGAGGSGALTCADAYAESDCGICGEKSCCKEMDACLADKNCLACLQGDDTKCNGNVLAALNTCLDTKCKNECVGVCNDGGTNYSGTDACDKCQTAEFAANGCCANEAAACSANQDCLDLNTCLGNCAGNDQACIDACAAKSPNGIDDFNGIIACTYGDGATTPGACGTVCTDPGSSTCNDGGTDYGAANATNCGKCQDAEFADGGCCINEANACASNQACLDLNTCLGNCAGNDQACIDACAAKSPNGINDFNNLITCTFGDGSGTVGACGTVCPANLKNSSPRALFGALFFVLVLRVDFLTSQETMRGCVRFFLFWVWFLWAWWGVAMALPPHLLALVVPGGQ